MERNEIDEPMEVLTARAEALVDEMTDFMVDLRALREKHRLHQGIVAERMGVSQSAVSQFESYDSNPTLSTIRRYAMAIGARLELRVIDDYEETPSGQRSVQPLPMEMGTASHLSWGRGHLAAR